MMCNKTKNKLEIFRKNENKSNITKILQKYENYITKNKKYCFFWYYDVKLL